MPTNETTTTFAYKDLVIDFTSSFKLMWNDEGSRGERDGAYWRPLIPNDPKYRNFYPVGDLGWNNHEDVNGKTAIAVVKDAKGDAGDALRKPEGFDKVWTDQGSGSWKNGSMWRPRPPAGYVALGLVCNAEYDPPSVDTIRCVRTDLVVAASPGMLVWDDRGTNAWFNFGSWRIAAPDAPEGEIFLSPGTFIGADKHDAPTRDANAYALRLLMPQEAPQTPKPPAPVLRGYTEPGLLGKDTVTYTTILPWFTVSDPNLSPIEQIMKSPEYRLHRVDRYKCFGWGYNDTEAPQRREFQYEEGTDGSKSREFSETTSIEFSVGWKGGAWECSAKLSQSFTHSETSTEGWSKKKTSIIGLEVPADTSVAAYTLESTYTLYRSDGSQVTTIRVDYEGGGGVYWTQYPPKKAAQTPKQAAATQRAAAQKVAAQKKAAQKKVAQKKAAATKTVATKTAAAKTTPTSTKPR